MRAKQAVVLSALAWAVATSLPAHEPVVFGDLAVAAEGVTFGDSCQLTLQLGQVFGDGAIVYSEPSHTALGVLLPTKDARGPEQTEVLALAKETATPLITGPVAGSEPSFVTSAQPEGDDRIVIQAVTDDGPRVVVDARVGSEDFAFRSFFSEPGKGVGPPGPGMTHCCNYPDCAEACTTCKGPAFTCCGCRRGAADIHCGHINCWELP